MGPAEADQTQGAGVTALALTEEGTEATGEGCVESSTKQGGSTAEPRLPAHTTPLLLTHVSHLAMVGFMEKAF